MVLPKSPAETPRVFCKVCLKRVLKIDALMEETPGNGAYFCSARCYEKWRERRTTDAPAHPA